MYSRIASPRDRHRVQRDDARGDADLEVEGEEAPRERRGPGAPPRHGAELDAARGPVEEPVRHAELRVEDERDDLGNEERRDERVLEVRRQHRWRAHPPTCSSAAAGG
jgi:hypothetical protein